MTGLLVDSSTRRLLASAAVVAALVSANASAAQAETTALVWSPRTVAYPNPDNGVVLSVNDAGYATVQSSPNVNVLVRPDGSITPVAVPGADLSFLVLNGLADDGAVVVNTQDPARGYVFEAGALDRRGFDDSAPYQFTAISPAGRVAFTTHDPACSCDQVGLVAPDGTRRYVALPAGVMGGGIDDVTDTGWAAGAVYVPGVGSVAARWRPDGSVETLSGAAPGIAFGITDDGAAVGCGLAAGVPHARLWRADGSSVSLQPPATSSSCAVSVSERKVVAIQAATGNIYAGGLPAPVYELNVPAGDVSPQGFLWSGGLFQSLDAQTVPPVGPGTILPFSLSRATKYAGGFVQQNELNKYAPIILRSTASATVSIKIGIGSR